MPHCLARLLITELGWRGAAFYRVADISSFWFLSCSCCGLRSVCRRGGAGGSARSDSNLGACRTRSPSRGSVSPERCVHLHCADAGASRAARHRYRMQPADRRGPAAGADGFGRRRPPVLRIAGRSHRSPSSLFIASLAQTSVVLLVCPTRTSRRCSSFPCCSASALPASMTFLLICAREAAPLRMSGTAMAVVFHRGLDRNGDWKLSGRLFLRRHGSLFAVPCDRRDRWGRRIC